MPELYWTQKSFPGRIAVAGRPRGGDWLADEMAAWRMSGVDMIVSLLDAREIMELALSDEAAEAAAAGLAFAHFPIADRGVPRAEPARRFLRGLAGAVTDGQTLAVHCRVGLGRSPMVVAAVLVLLGEPAANAWALVEAARSQPVPDTAAQRAWVYDLAGEPA